MAFALGLLVAGLLVVIVAPAIWRRAMRLARVRIEASVPLSRTEIEADKDQLRAGYAVSNRRLEIETERFRQRAAEGNIQLSRRSDEVAALSREKQGLQRTVEQLETRITGLASSLAATETRLAGANADIAARDGQLSEQGAHLATVRAELAAVQLMTEELRLEMVARQTEIGNLSDALAEKAAAEQLAAARHQQIVAALDAEQAQGADGRKRIDGLEAGLAALQIERTGRMADLERRAAEVRALEEQLAASRSNRDALAEESARIAADRDRLVSELAERVREVAALTARMGSAGQADDIVADGDNLRKALAAAEAEKEELVRRVAMLEGSVEALRGENTELQRIAGADWESERDENRRLRERLNEIAASVEQLARSGEANTDAAPEPPRGTPAAVPLPARPPHAGEIEDGDAAAAERPRAVHAARH